MMHDEIRAAVAKLCEGYPGPYWRALDRERAYPSDFVAELTRSGFLAALIPQAYGGSGLPLSAAAAILEEIQAAGCNGASCHAQMYVMGTLLRHGSEAQKQRYLPRIATGELRLQAFGVTEPDSGTDTSSITTTARREGNHYVIRGRKIWTSRAEHSDLMIVLARTSPIAEGKKRTSGLSVFLLDMHEAKRNGLTIDPIRTMMNHATTSIGFDDVPVPAENLIGTEGEGFRYILSGMNAERILIAAECVGDARWFIQRSTAYARDRMVFGRPIGQNQGIQHPLAERWMELEAAELMTYKAAWLYDQKQPCGAEANAAKYLGGEAGFRACETAMLTHGGMGYAKEFHIERYFREAMIPRLAPVSSQMILCFIAEKVLGLPKSY